MNFMTVFPAARNVHLTKDVGAIPYTLCKEFGYESTIVCFENDEYDYKKEFMPELNIEFIKKGNERIKSLEYVIKNAKKIDVLNMYHLSIGKSLLCMMAYKIINPTGRTYLKMDLDLRTISLIENYGSIKKQILRYMVKSVDFISAESTEIAKRASLVLKKPVDYIPNGILDYCDYGNIDLNDCKKNIFLTVGRLGSEQKATEDLVLAFAEVYKKVDWDLWLVGSCENNIEKFIEQIIEENENLGCRIKIFGEITDKEELNRIYRLAKVMVLPSKWEGFALVNVEAMVNGCMLLLSDQVTPANDFARESNHVCVTPYGDVLQLADAMCKISTYEVDANLISKYAISKYSWRKICKIINQKITNL